MALLSCNLDCGENAAGNRHTKICLRASYCLREVERVCAHVSVYLQMRRGVLTRLFSADHACLSTHRYKNLAKYCKGVQKAGPKDAAVHK